MNFAKARFNMLEQQIRTCHVYSDEALNLFNIVKREDFVPTAYRNLALAQIEIPLGHDACMLLPQIEAGALHYLQPRITDKVLEIGTGSGYMATLLAACTTQVWSVEIDPALADQARARLQQQAIHNVTVSCGDASLGWPAQAPYDVIMISGGLATLPPELLAQLKINGRLFAFIGEAPLMQAQLITRTSEYSYETQVLFETQVPMLRNARQPDRFSF